MTVLAVGSCMVMGAAAQTRWSTPRVLYPLTLLGRWSYEIYLTHMFVVFASFALFTAAGRAPVAIPVLFTAVIVVSGLLGGLVARFYSEPMNRRIRRRLGIGSGRLGSAR